MGEQLGGLVRHGGVRTGLDAREAEDVEQVQQLVARLAELGGAHRAPRAVARLTARTITKSAAKASGVPKSSSSAREGGAAVHDRAREVGVVPLPAAAAMARSIALRALASRSTTAAASAMRSSVNGSRDR